MSSSVQTAHALRTRVNNLPFLIPQVANFLLQTPNLTPADISRMAAFLNAAEALVALPNYQALVHASRADQHCVRCHATFTDESNGPRACSIPHVFDTEPERLGSDTFMYKSACCGSQVELEEEGYGNYDYQNLDRLGVCYEGRHTADVDEVEDEEEYNDANIRRCKFDQQTGECIRDWIDDEDPIFLGRFD